jgi:hypothetical protein
MDRKIFKPIALTIIAVLLIAVAISGSIDKKSEEYTSEAFTRSLITFGIARGLNGVISVAQGTEVALHPAGLGINFTPGQILDPINDLVEQFSWVMLASSASLGIQKVLLVISSTLVLTIVFVFLLALFILSVWRENLFNPVISKYLTLSVVVLLFIRFSVPVAMLASEGIYRLFLQEQFIESSNSLEKAQEEISKISEEEKLAYTNEDEGIVEKAKRFLNSTTQSISINSQITKYQQLASDTTEHAINIIVVFVLQTVLIPLLFLWLTYKSCRFLWIRILPV